MWDGDSPGLCPRSLDSPEIVLGPVLQLLAIWGDTWKPWESESEARVGEGSLPSRGPLPGVHTPSQLLAPYFRGQGWHRGNRRAVDSIIFPHMVCGFHLCCLRGLQMQGYWLVDIENHCYLGAMKGLWLFCERALVFDRCILTTGCGKGWSHVPNCWMGEREFPIPFCLL